MRGLGSLWRSWLGLFLCFGLKQSACCWAYEPSSHITRGIYCSAQPLLSAAYWAPYGGNYAFSPEAAHTGQYSLKVVTNTTQSPGSGVVQIVQFNQAAPAPIKVSGWSKAVNVAEDIKDWRYAIYLDLTYEDGSPWHMQIASFSGGTHDWEYSETILHPKKAVAQARVYVFLRSRIGTAYFDDLYVGLVEGPNLLRNAGFEAEDREDKSTQKAIYETYKSLHANAIHTYMSGAPDFWRDSDGKSNAHVRQFLSEARKQGIGVWLTTSEPPQPALQNAQDTNFPQYHCVNWRWGAAWTETLRLAAAYDFAGISVVPDEYNWTNTPLRDRYSRHSDPQIAEFYKQLPAMCNCPVCAALYEKAFGEKLPSLALGMSFPEASLPYLRYLKFRYDSTTQWIARNVQAIKAINPRIRADSLICVTPICSDRFWDPGVAWDRLGETGLDFPTTDPYILLHNYLGDSTHYYVTETAVHLTGSTPKRQCGIVLEASRLRKEYRELEPVEIYGSALSAVCHGAREIAYWHYSHLTDQSKTTDRADVSRACVRGVYGLLQAADAWLGGLHPPQLIAFLYSRASDDLWRFYAEHSGQNAPQNPENNLRYAAMAQKEVLYYLLRRGIPFDLYYLESVREKQLAPYRIIIVPFPLAIADSQFSMLKQLALHGKTIIFTSQWGSLDELGQKRPAPVFATLFNVKAPPQDPQTIMKWRLGKGSFIYLGDAYGYGLPVHRNNQKRTRQERIWPDPLHRERVAVWDKLLQEACVKEPWTLAHFTDKDVEATAVFNARQEPILLAINWENEPQKVALRAPFVKRTIWEGFRLTAEGRYVPSRIKGQLKNGVVQITLTLQPQEACLWRGVR